VTTINYPTHDLKKLVQQKEWHVVVVADKKTPHDWHLDNCTFLSVKQQEQLGYRITKLIPWNHYSRKNIGYLYAIAHGATVIYDTDDDNALTCDTLTYFPEETAMSVCETKSLCVNPYAYFGQPSVWPRGYPLEYIQQTDSFTVTTKKVYPLIQQGLVNNDPDVDAIFRLTRGNIVNFVNKEPLCLPSGTLCPFNTQNTLTHTKAFWGLLIPITTSFRVCDIWRGYWAQRLLWDIGGSLCFTEPNVIQERNAHNLMKDFADEVDLYLKSGPLARLLGAWQPHNSLFSDRIHELTELMATNNFWGNKEIELVDAWIQDLQDAGYQFPDVVT
jgi:hypothetical protein